MKQIELDHRFDYFPPNPRANDMHDEVRILFKDLAESLNGEFESSREASRMFTHLEEAHAWAHAHIARNVS